MRLEVVDVPWNLVSAKRVILTVCNSSFHEGDVVEIHKKDKVAIAAIHKMEENDANTIAMDKYLRTNLAVKIGDEANFEIYAVDNPPDAQNMEILVPKGTKIAEEEVKSSLTGLYVREGERQYLPMSGLEAQISTTVPGGVVRITKQTNVLLKPGIPKVEEQKRKGFKWLTERPEERFEDIAGLDEAKRELKENVVYAIDKEKRAIFDAMKVKVKKGMLLCGPPGTGKTVLAKAAAAEASASFIYVASSELKGKYYGETEKNMREVFSEAEANAPCIIFFDEIDAIAYTRSPEYSVNVLQQLLTLMDHIQKLDVYVIGATNRVELIDSALLRFGRFTGLMIVLPDCPAREEIFKIHLKETPTESIDYKELATVTEGFSGAMIAGVCNGAKMRALRENQYLPNTKVKLKHLTVEIDKARSWLTSERPDMYNR